MSNAISKHLVIALLSLSFLALNAAHSKENRKETYEQLDLFGQVFDLIKSKYVEEVKSKELIEAAINGMLSSLDPHSGFLVPKSYDVRAWPIDSAASLLSFEMLSSFDAFPEALGTALEAI